MLLAERIVPTGIMGCYTPMGSLSGLAIALPFRSVDRSVDPALQMYKVELVLIDSTLL